MKIQIVCVIVLMWSAILLALNEETYSDVQGMQFPCLSPDGKQIAFSYQGDIWTVPIVGGAAKRITLHRANDIKPRWSPDGKWIAFSSDRSGNFDIWLMAANQGIPKQITFHSSWDSICDWSPDGKWLIFSSYRSGDIEVWKIPAKGGFSIKITQDQGRDAQVSPDGKTIIYNRGTASLWRKGYQGTSNWEIYICPTSGGIPTKLTNYQGNDIHPYFAPGGKYIYYLSEHLILSDNGNSKPIYNLWRMTNSGQDAKQITTFTKDIHAPYFSHNHKHMIFEMDFRIWITTLGEKSKPKLVPIQIFSDDKGEQQTTKIVTSGSEMGHWSPDNSQIAFVLNGDIWIMPAQGGEAEQLTSGIAKDEWPRFSPDGDSIAYCSNKSGNSDIYILSLETNEETQLTKHQSDDFYHSWSPDSKKLLFTSERSGNRDIWEITTKKENLRQLTKGKNSEDDAVFSPDGKWIAFDSAESGHQEIWIMPGDGDYSQAEQITEHEGLSQVPSWSKDSKMVAYETHDSDDNTSVRVTSLSGKSMTIVSDATVPCWSPNGKKILFEATKNDAKNIHQISAPTEINTGTMIPFIARKKIDLQKQRGQVFQEAWQAINENFYDAKFHGNDWKQIGEKYLSIALKAQTDMELNTIINRMLGELKASHIGISSPSNTNNFNTGYLGWALIPVPGKRGLLVDKVLKDGPADKAWIRKGDFIFQINDQIITHNTNLATVFNKTVGKEIKIYVSSNNKVENGRFIKVTPVSLSKINNIKYHHWVLKRIHLVRKKTGGKVLYLHLPEMDKTYLQYFRRAIKQYYGQAQGMILDVRENIGGLIHQELLLLLTQKPYINFKSRKTKQQKQPSLYWDKPVVLLTNENSFSDAEVFAAAFKHLKIGEIVGTSTAGGVIGTRDITLSNGGSFRVPSVGYYTLCGKNLEGLGVAPDHNVKETAADRIQGRDPQLLKAIQIVLKEIVISSSEAPMSEKTTRDVKTVNQGNDE